MLDILDGAIKHERDIDNLIKQYILYGTDIQKEFAIRVLARQLSQFKTSVEEFVNTTLK